ncbi:DEAD/DEAH box helicase family protein, partial [Vibrio parahaemolyticus VP2007-007]
GTRTF